jgi:ribosomal-protein-alanine N-acetyltransferase
MRDSGQPVLTGGGGLVLRPWRPDDAADLMAAYADPAIQRWHRRRLDSVAEARELIDDWTAEWTAESTAETRACWAVTHRG